MSFQQGLSGLAAASRNLDAIGNNVANASTVGFKSSSLVFADVYANSLGASVGNSIGIGTAVAAVQANFGQGNLRSTLSQNLVNEFKVGGSGGATKFSNEINASHFSGTPLADMGGFALDINDVGISQPWATGSTSAREATTRIVENTLSWLKNTHNVQAGFAYTRADVWLENRQHVPTITFGVNSNDPINSLFSAGNFPGSSNAQRTAAAELYAMLTGRVDGITAELRLDEESDEYRYLGLGVQRARLTDYAMFVADTWRWKPNFTLNLGLRYVLQPAFYPLNNSYSKATVEDVCGVSGISPNGGCNIFQPGNMPGRVPQFLQYGKGEGAYNTDKNNIAPSIGFAWTLPPSGGLLGLLVGQQPADSVLRAGYTLGYNRPGTSDFTGAIAANPGISLSASRNHGIGNLGTPGSIFFRNTNQLGPPDFPLTRNYPLTDVQTADITAFDQNLQVPYSQTWTAGWQRKLTGDLAFEARYVGTRSLQSWQTYNFNEVNVIENGFVDEFRLAQQNLQANLAANRGATMAYFGPGTGTTRCRSRWPTSPGPPRRRPALRPPTAGRSGPAPRSSTSSPSATPIRTASPTRSTLTSRVGTTR